MIKLTSPITRDELQWGIAARILSPVARQWSLENIEYLNAENTGVFSGSVKVDKGLKRKVITIVRYLQPAGKVSRKSLCPFAESAGCERDCLVSSGMLGKTPAQRAVTKRTVLMLLRPVNFIAAQDREITAAAKKAKRDGFDFAVRLNGTTDRDEQLVYKRHPTVQFYEYTKCIAFIERNTLENVHYTFSLSMAYGARKSAVTALERGYNIATAWNTKGAQGDSLELPTDLPSFDKDDLRYMDPQGSVGSLTSKGTNLEHRQALDSVKDTFWITSANVTDFRRMVDWAAIKC